MEAKWIVEIKLTTKSYKSLHLYVVRYNRIPEKLCNMIRRNAFIMSVSDAVFRHLYKVDWKANRSVIIYSYAYAGQLT